MTRKRSAITILHGVAFAFQTSHALSKLPLDKLEDSELMKALDNLLKLIRQRSEGWWRFRPQDMADLLEASQTLGRLDIALLEIVQ